MERVISCFGLLVMLSLAWFLSTGKRRAPWRVIGGGVGLQFLLAALVLHGPGGEQFFDQVGEVFRKLLAFVDEGSLLLFGINPRDGEQELLPPAVSLMRTFAFGVLPTIIFFSSLMSVLYHLGIMQLVVRAFAWVMQRTLGTSGAETLSVAANIFVGQTEAPLVIRPYIAQMTLSELMVVMVGGFATIAGGVMAAYVSFGINAGDLLTASVISAPAALVVAKIMQPETEDAATAGKAARFERTTGNVIEAAAEGASTGLALALNVGAMLIAFVALVAMINAIVGAAGAWIGYTGEYAWSLQKAFGYAFWPLAWSMGIAKSDCYVAGQLLGEKMVLNEFYAYLSLGKTINEGALEPRSVRIVTYALCGFANFSSIGIQLGGIGAIAPDRRADLARLGLRAMLGGTLAAFMTACVAGILM